jgi:uncharacterized membrane protein
MTRKKQNKLKVIWKPVENISEEEVGRIWNRIFDILFDETEKQIERDEVE